VNVSDLLMANMKKSGEAKAKGQYQYAAGESVVATCVATTFFSHDLAPPPAAAKTRNSGRGRRTMRISMKLKTGKTGTLSTALLFVTLTAGSGLGADSQRCANTFRIR